MADRTHAHALRPVATGGGARSAVSKPKPKPQPAPDAARDPNTAHRFAQVPVRPPVALPVQARLAISRPGDKYEQEADRVADAVLGMAAPAAAGRPDDEDPPGDAHGEQGAPRITPLLSTQPASETETAPAGSTDLEQRLERL